MQKLIYIALLGIIGLVKFVSIADGQMPPRNPYWGPKSNQNQKQDSSIRPFQINVDETALMDLKTRLSLEIESNRLAPPLESTAFQYGFNTDYLKKVLKYWSEKYDWRAREKLLNKYPHFKTNIFGIGIHFQHVKSSSNIKYKRTRPILLLHGWPGSFVEFQKIIPLLIDPVNPDLNFELVILSLPGYGFSEASHQQGLGPLEMGQIFVLLMRRLGHELFYVQGGDWGSVIGSNMAAVYPKRAFVAPADPKNVYPLSQKWIPTALGETGYFHLHATKPDTIGVGLSNSPSGLLAYILEKFSSWTNIGWKVRKDGGLDGYYNMNELLDDVMIYWVTNTITSSFRLYLEAYSPKQRAYKLDNAPVDVPTACLHPENEAIFAQPRFTLQDRYRKLERYNIAPKSGHFLAFENPELLARDVLQFINILEKSDSSRG